jgi:hypothetical protein
VPPRRPDRAPGLVCAEQPRVRFPENINLARCSGGYLGARRRPKKRAAPRGAGYSSGVLIVVECTTVYLASVPAAVFCQIDWGLSIDKETPPGRTPGGLKFQRRSMLRKRQSR